MHLCVWALCLPQIQLSSYTETNERLKYGQSWITYTKHAWWLTLLSRRRSTATHLLFCLSFLSKARIMTGPLLTSDLPLCGLLRRPRTRCWNLVLWAKREKHQLTISSLSILWAIREAPPMRLMPFKTVFYLLLLCPDAVFLNQFYHVWLKAPF